MPKDIPVNFTEHIARSMLMYAQSALIDRALPGVRDGLKPVQLRILYSMYQSGYTSNKPHKKSARTVGEVMSSFHPHGDSSIYDSKVKMAQDFYTNHPLVNFKGNEGTIYGDPHAASRYTESRLSKFTEEVLVKDMKTKPVDFRPNYDNQTEEPKVLPARLPNLLVNGSFGIAVGYASSFAPHNLEDVGKAVHLVAENPNVTVKEIVDVLKPDFPTGGIIVNSNNVYSAYETGIGNIRLRSRAEIETDKKGNETIVITEIPYMTTTASVTENIIEKIKDGVVTGIANIKDQSRGGKIRIEIIVDKNASASVVENQLYKLTNLEVTYKILLVAVDKNSNFKVYTIKEIIEEWLAFRKETIRRIYVKKISDNKHRMHIIEGLLAALDDIDWVIDTIKTNKKLEDAKDKIKKRFNLSTAQADAIVEIRLKTLNGLQRDELENEYHDLEEKSQELITVISNPSKLLGIILDEVDEIVKKFKQKRKTSLENFDTTITTEDIIEDKNYMITYTRNGFIKRLEHEFNDQKRGGKGTSIGQVKEGDVLKDLLYANSKDHFLAFTNTGRVIDVKVWQIPEVNSLKNNGKPFNSFLKLKKDESIVAVTNLTNDEFNDDNSSLIFATKNGIVKRTLLSEFNKSVRQDGIIAIKIREDDELLDVKYVKDISESSIFLATSKGIAIRFGVEDIPEVARPTFGVKGITLADNDSVMSMELVNNSTEDSHIVVISSNGLGKLVESSEFPVQNRGGKGRILAKLREGTNIVSANFVDDLEDSLIVFTEKKAISTQLSNISILLRPTFGNRVINTNDDGGVLGITLK